jgi:tricorn protease
MFRRLFPGAPARRARRIGLAVVATILTLCLTPPLDRSVRAQTPSNLGYYRFPAIAGDSVVFTAEGDLWRVPLAGGVAERLTSHADQEVNACVSPDGRTVAFAASYEGPREVYVLPLGGGLPRRLTWQGGPAFPVGWTRDGQVLYTTARHSTLPNRQLFTVDPTTLAQTAVPLAQASDGAYGPDGTLFFTRLPFQGSHTRRYKGGTAQKIWKLAPGAPEAVALTADYEGTSKTPMFWNDRVYFASDRDGTMNLWSMTTDGKDIKQLTHHADYEVRSPSLANGRIAYQLGADIHVFDIGQNADRLLPVTLVSDFDQMRERWIADPIEWVTTAHLSPSGDRVVLTARGQVFVAPAQQGRLVEATRSKQVRYRSARFMPDGKTLVALSDESGEVEFWTMPANGTAAPTQLTRDGVVLRWDGVPSPDGKRLAHHDKNQQLWIFDLDKKTDTKIAENLDGGFDDLAWSPDSSMLAYTAPDENQLSRIYLWQAAANRSIPVTSDRYDSYSPYWTSDGKWLYFLSDRHFESVVRSPWGSREPEPFFDKQTKVYHVALAPGLRSPFEPDDELNPKKEESKDKSEEKKDDGDKKPSPPQKSSGAKPAGAAATKSQAGAGAAPSKFVADLTGIMERLQDVPVPPGNYGNLALDEKRLYFLSRDADSPKATLKVFPLENKKPEIETFLEDVRGFELSADRKKLLIRREKTLYVIDAGPKPPPSGELGKFTVPLKDWRLHFDVRDEWRQMFTEAWRLERDYFYDRAMHGVDWNAAKAKYSPLAARVTDREELADAIAQLVSELSALHIFVVGGDRREGQDKVWPATLGAVLERDQAAGGYRVGHIYQNDPDRPDELSPLARPGVNVHEGDIIEQVNGAATLSVPDVMQLLRTQADQQVLLRVKPSRGGDSRDVIVRPISDGRDEDLRYDEWEYTRRLQVERAGDHKIGYLHLRAMGSGDIAQWTRDYYPVFNRDGLIIDVRHNRGGNIDSWLLGRLLRKAWFYWQPRIGRPYWNMQYAFRGHVVVLIDDFTASDGEAFAEGFRRLGLGKLIGTRTWGGEIWLTASNSLVDRGIATAAEFGVYGPEGAWLIEGHGVDPDIVVDNEPHATFGGKDAQLEAAVAHLQELIRTKPVPVPPAPPYPIKRLPTTTAGGQQ